MEIQNNGVKMNDFNEEENILFDMEDLAEIVGNHERNTGIGYTDDEMVEIATWLNRIEMSNVLVGMVLDGFLDINVDMTMKDNDDRIKFSLTEEGKKHSKEGVDNIKKILRDEF